MDVRKHMKIESVTETAEDITVVTTGAKYVFDKSAEKGRILCHQELNEKRLLATIELSWSLGSLSIKHQDETSCVLNQMQGADSCGYLRAQINSDSLLELCWLGEMSIACLGNFRPEYGAEEAGNVLMIDESGGIGLYPYPGARRTELSNFADSRWRADYALDEGRLLISVFPPRPFDYRRSLDDSIAHIGLIGPPAYPSDQMIEEAREYANILVLHTQIWQGKLTSAGQALTSLDEAVEDASFCAFDYVPVDERELVRVVEKAHALGMRVIPYMSPFYSMARGDDFLDRVESALERYGFDGVYFDGISMDVLYSYQLIRETRARLGDKLIYLHCTGDPLSVNVYCPFINTYADFVLRAEWGTGEFDDRYLRYVVSGFNTSNTVNYICYYTYSLEFMRRLIDPALAVNARFYLGMPETEREVLLKEEYFPKLDEQRSRAMSEGSLSGSRPPE